MILEKDSSVLGYPGETSRALNADHHNVCKYDSPSDPNYVTVRNALKSIVCKIILSNRSEKLPLPTRKQSQDLRSMLAITELPDVDYIFYRDQWVKGTNDWVLQERKYLEWLHIRDPAPLLWLNGGAATGKSVLSSFIINDLMEQGLSCQYFFIRFGEPRKRTLSLLLRSITYQLARRVPAFMQRVLQLADEAIDFETADSKTMWEHVFKCTLFDMSGIQPLYWIIDGIDEANDPREVMRLFSDLSRSSSTIRVLVVGRNTSDTSFAFEKLPGTLKAGAINIEGHTEDLRSYIHQELTMYGTAQFRDETVQRIIRGAQNNFLVSIEKSSILLEEMLTFQWVRLAVGKLNLSHTQADVELALQQLPVGMEGLYDRMAASIIQNPSVTDRTLASNIIQCITCSLRLLTVTELAQALNLDTVNVLDFQRSIVDLCGGFVVIDNGGNVAMIHQTAREYLFNRTGHSFFVDTGTAHEQLFLNCIRSLLTVGLRAKVKTNQTPEFLEYAANSWSSHLTLSPRHSKEVEGSLHEFLNGHWVLTWIYVLATNGQLRVLVTASENLSKYLKDSALYDSTNRIAKQALVESWAEDFMRVIGKFGNILRQDPESIYKFIPPFCPHNSAIFKQFGRNKDKNILVSGLSMKNWDDSIARLSFGFGTFASSISAAGTQIAVLISSGSVLLYDSSVFEEVAASPIQHGERLYRLELNITGTLLATYGYFTTKIWEISTGKCKMSIKNIESRPRPLAMLWTNNSTKLLVGMDDRKIRSLDLSQASFQTWHVVAELEEQELEGHFLNSPNHMALSKDGKLITVAYRGHPLSAWEIDGPVPIGHCWRKREETARGEVIEAVWHPHDLLVLGLYIEGVVFKWRPYDDIIDEIAVGASGLAISRDGNLFATGDVRGTIKLYTTSDFCQLYQLASEDLVVGLAFSPDLNRFYDIRGYYGNAWEPSALIRYAVQKDKGQIKSGKEEPIESLSRRFPISQNRSRRIDSITVLATSPIGRFYCSGTEKGTVRLHDMQQQGSATNLYNSQGLLSIEQLSWSSDERYICFSDTSKKVTIMSITLTASSSDPCIETKAEALVQDSNNESILQLLFHPHSQRLLVCCLSTIHIISLATSSVTVSSEIHTPKCIWIIHPQDPALVIGVGSSSLSIWDWSLTERQIYTIIHPQHESMPSNPKDFTDQKTVDRALVTLDKKHILVQISFLNQNSKEKVFFYLESRFLSPFVIASPDVDQGNGSRAICASILPRDISSQIALPLSFIAHDSLIFLSKSHSICSWRFPFGSDHMSSSSFSTTNSQAHKATTATNSRTLLNHDQRIDNVRAIARNHVTQLFWLPGDWIGRDSLALCQIWGIERSLLCPRNGEVAVVQCAALA